MKREDALKQQIAELEKLLALKDKRIAELEQQNTPGIVYIPTPFYTEPPSPWWGIQPPYRPWTGPTCEMGGAVVNGTTVGLTATADCDELPI